MLEWLTVISLILFGLALLILELIFIPGTTLIGIIGLLSAIFGIYLGYSYFGVTIGSLIFAGTALATGLAVYRSFKSGTWDKMSLKLKIDSKVNEDEDEILVGQRGVTTSALRPSGTADFNGNLREVRTLGLFLPAKSIVEVIRVERKKIWIEEVKLNDGSQEMEEQN